MPDFFSSYVQLKSLKIRNIKYFEKDQIIKNLCQIKRPLLSKIGLDNLDIPSKRLIKFLQSYHLEELDYYNKTCDVKKDFKKLGIILVEGFNLKALRFESSKSFHDGKLNFDNMVNLVKLSLDFSYGKDLTLELGGAKSLRELQVECRDLVLNIDESNVLEKLDLDVLSLRCKNKCFRNLKVLAIESSVDNFSLLNNLDVNLEVFEIYHLLGERLEINGDLLSFFEKNLNLREFHTGGNVDVELFIYVLHKLYFLEALSISFEFSLYNLINLAEALINQKNMRSFIIKNYNISIDDQKYIGAFYETLIKHLNIKELRIPFERDSHYAIELISKNPNIKFLF